jgi:hypothetical protein
MLWKKLGKIIERLRKIGQTINLTPSLGAKHDKI